MFQILGRNGFELEKRYPGFFLLQAAAGGLIGGLLAIIFLVAQHEEQNSLNSLLLLMFMGAPFFMGFTSFASLGLSLFLWFPSWCCNFRMKLVTRIAILTIIVVLLSLLLIHGEHIHVAREGTTWPFFLKVIAVCALVSVPTGSLVGSKIRLWKIFSFGSVAVRLVNRIFRGTSESKLALVATLPLRLLSASLLASWFLVVASLWRDLASRYEYLGASAFVGLYLALGVWLSYRSPRISILLTLACFLNIVVSAFACFAFLDPFNEFGDFSVPIVIACAIFVLSWTWCLVARSCVSLVALPDEHPVQRFQDDAHMCLGRRFEHWQMTSQS